jgi:hypothetical protein
VALMNDDEKKSEEEIENENENENKFYDGVAKVANFVKERLDDTISPGALNDTVEEYVEEDR